LYFEKRKYSQGFNVNIVRALIKKGEENSINITELVFGATPLIWAVCCKNLEIVNVLIEYKADINLKDNCGKTPFHYAVLTQNLDIVNVLIEYKADINTQDCLLETPLHYAVFLRNPEIINVLFKNKNLSSLGDCHCFTPLHYAALYNDRETVNLFLEHKFVTFRPGVKFDKDPCSTLIDDCVIEVKNSYRHRSFRNVTDGFEETPPDIAILSKYVDEGLPLTDRFYFWGGLPLFYKKKCDMYKN